MLIPEFELSMSESSVQLFNLDATNITAPKYSLKELWMESISVTDLLILTG